MKKEELYTLFKKVVSNKFNSKYLAKIPQAMIVYRLSLNYSQPEFCNLVGIKRWRLHEMERGIVKFLNVERSEQFMTKIKIAFKKEDIRQLKFATIYENYHIFQLKRVFNSKRAKYARSLVKPASNLLKGLKSNLGNKATNLFEEKIQHILTSSKVDYKIHCLIESVNKKVISDFVIFKDNIPKVVIEVRQAQPKNKRRFYDLLKMHAIRIDHKLQGIKLRWPNLKTIAVLSSKHIPIKTLSPNLTAEFLNTDKIIVDSDLDQLPIYIKSVLRKPF